MDVIFGIDSLKTFTNVSVDILDNLYCAKPLTTPLSLELHVIQTAKEDLKKMFSNCDYDIKKISELIQAKGWDLEKVEAFLSLLERKKTELLYSALVHENSLHGEAVSDFDWLLKLVCGTSSSKALRYPLLQMIFSTINCNGDEQQRVYDVNKEMLEKLISVLENSIENE